MPKECKLKNIIVEKVTKYHYFYRYIRSDINSTFYLFIAISIKEILFSIITYNTVF